MDAPVRGQSLSERLKGTQLPPLNIEQRRQSRIRSIKRRSDTSESSVCHKAARVDRQPLHRDYFADLHQKRTFCASDCVSRLSKELGVKSETDGFTGTLIRGLRMDGRQSEAVWKKIKNELDVSWALVALEEGVRLARGGKYAEALQSYEQSLSLNPHSCDAYVARGAAYANQGFYDEALSDFDKALDIHPSDKNALEYKQRIARRRMERQDRTHTNAPQGQLQYGQGTFQFRCPVCRGLLIGLFGRGLPLKTVRSTPDDQQIQSALDVLKRHKKRQDRGRHKKKRHRHN